MVTIVVFFRYLYSRRERWSAQNNAAPEIGT